MYRRRYLAALVSSATGMVAGCLNSPGRNGGILEVFAADAPAAATVTAATDDPIDDVDPIKTGLVDAHTHAGTATVVVAASEYERVADALAAVPWYDRIEDDGNAMSGNYVRYEDATYVVVLTPICSDSRLRTTYAERGTYGWGGCFDYEGS